MAKQSGLGQNFYVDGYNISGDVGSIDSLGSPMDVQEMTGIDKSGYERVGLLRDGALEFTSFFNPTAGQEHTALSSLPTAARLVTWTAQGTSIGHAAASLQCKQVGYDWKREDSGALTISTECQADSYGLEWGQLLTAGVRTDTTATSPATGLDTTASLAFGLQAYLHVFAFTGTSVTIKLQDSADNATFADITSGAFTAVTALGAQRIAIATGATVRRYVRVITTGTFSNVQFSVNLVKNTSAVIF